MTNRLRRTTEHITMHPNSPPRSHSDRHAPTSRRDWRDEEQRQRADRGYDQRDADRSGDDSEESVAYYDTPRGGYSGRRESYYGQPNERSTSGRDAWGASAGRSSGRPMPSEYGFGDGSGTQGTDRQHAGKGPKGYKRSDDHIKDECCQLLQDHGELDASDIEVAVASGEVTLSGMVADRNQKRLAEQCCDQVRGVHDVHNQVRVQREGRDSQTQTSASRTSSSKS